MVNPKPLLDKITTKIHPLNKYLIKGEPKNMLDRKEVKLLTYNFCLVPWIFDLCVPCPYVKERCFDFILNHMELYDIICF